VDTQIVAAMRPPGGGRNPLSPRLLRHFNQLAMNELSDSTYQHVYTTMFSWWAQVARLPSEVAAMRCNIVDATLALYIAVRAKLLPTPAKGHYTFNMRDISKIFQGMQSVGSHVSCTTGALQTVMRTCAKFSCSLASGATLALLFYIIQLFVFMQQDSATDRIVLHSKTPNTCTMCDVLSLPQVS
jgi:hypothetical protein